MEDQVWEGGPSQWVNLGVFILCGLTAPLVIPVIYMVAKILQVRATRYELTGERLRLRQGVFSRRTDELELYRINDLATEEPWHLRLVGLGHLILYTTDKSTPTLKLRAVPKPEELREKFRAGIEAQRSKKGVRSFEVA